MKKLLTEQHIMMSIYAIRPPAAGRGNDEKGRNQYSRRSQNPHGAPENRRRVFLIFTCGTCYGRNGGSRDQ